MSDHFFFSFRFKSCFWFVYKFYIIPKIGAFCIIIMSWKKIKDRCILNSLTEESTSLLPELKLRSGRGVAGSGLCPLNYNFSCLRGGKQLP